MGKRVIRKYGYISMKVSALSQKEDAKIIVEGLLKVDGTLTSLADIMEEAEFLDEVFESYMGKGHPIEFLAPCIAAEIAENIADLYGMIVYDGDSNVSPSGLGEWGYYVNFVLGVVQLEVV